MAKCGNHGIIIPRDKKLLHRLYWIEQKTLPEMAEMFGVNHKSVMYAMHALGVPTRSKGKKPIRGCKVCGEPVHKIKHAGNGVQYGRLCRKHWNEHRNRLAREYKKDPRIKEIVRQRLKRWYFTGALKPERELSWLRQNRAMLRNVKRLLSRSKEQNREALKFLSEVSAQVRNSLT